MNKVIKNFKKDNRIQQNKSSGIRKMQTAAGGPIEKFKTRDINGNLVWMNINTGRTTSAAPEQDTIRNNTVNSVGGDVKTKQGRTKIAQKQVTSYNNRQYKVHNYADTITRLKQKRQDVVLDKQGGMLEFLKKGLNIHIKKKNRGKFTEYCGGEVTDACIRKAKASGNPTLVKRATFADNARHFKHRLGGSIVEAFKLRRQILNSL